MNRFPCQNDHTGSREASGMEAWRWVRNPGKTRWRLASGVSVGPHFPCISDKTQRGSVYSSLPLLDCQSLECRNWNLLISGALVLPGDKALNKGLVALVEGQNSLIKKMISLDSSSPDPYHACRLYHDCLHKSPQQLLYFFYIWSLQGVG